MASRSLLALLLLLMVSLTIPAVEASASNHRYAEKDVIPLYVNKVGPFNNPQEFYRFYSLPYCSEPNPQRPFRRLGEAIEGYDLTRSPIEMQFRVNEKPRSICDVELTSEDTKKFKFAVSRQYWMQLFLDDLPIYGLVGEMSEAPEQQHYVYTHWTFDIAHNNDRVISVNMTSENPKEVKVGEKLSFTYSVEWQATSVSFEDRFDTYLDSGFFEHKIHWFSVFNSFMLVIFLVGLVSMILLRTVLRDFAKFPGDDVLEEDSEESGWKQLHGDVFRAPKRLTLFAAVVGVGYQMAILGFSVLLFAMLGAYYRTRGTVVTAVVVGYALSSFVSGYVSGGYYLRSGGKNWIKCMLITASFLPMCVGTVIGSVNFFAMTHGALSGVSFGTTVVMIGIWMFVVLPLTLVGTIVGRNWSGQTSNPCRINPVPRQIPDKAWYLQPVCIIVMGGVLPFASIFIEVYFLFTSFWHYKYYYVYGFLLLELVILAMITVCVSIVSTFFLLSTEDYRWQWSAFLGSASTAVYVFLYSAFYYQQRTMMTGILQTVLYFGYMFVFCLCLGLLCGGIGFWGSSLFVHRIYNIVKIE